MAYLFIAPAVDSIRLLRISYAIPAALFYGAFVLTAAFFGLAMLAGQRRGLKLDALEAVLLAAFVVSVTATIKYQGSIADIGGNALRLILSLAAYRASREMLLHPSMSGLPRRLAIWAPLGVALGVGVIYALGVFGGLPVYLGMSTEGAFLGIAYVLAFATRHRTFWVLALSALVVAGGKRGPMLALALIFLLYVGLVLNEKGLSKRFLTNLAAGLALWTLLVGATVAAVGPDRIWDSLPYNLQQRFTTLGLGGEVGFDASLATSGRSEEIMLVADAWRLNPTAILTGFGLGASVTNDYGETVSTIHVSPVALTFIFGVPLGLLLFALPCLWIATTAMRGLGSLSQAELFWLLAAVGMLGTSLGVFSFLQAPVFWMGLGVMRAMWVARSVPRPRPAVGAAPAN